ncbi:MAG TPA: hypothetical protein VK828_13040 [Terriglobales bacterium]|jgi:hypothetical protein|nr:hypothetical protein [Terriglobales bacterium]
MDPTIILEIILVLAGLWAAKELYVRFFARTVVRNALSAVGQRALERTPDRIALMRVDSPAWTHGPAVEQQAAPLRDAGFKDLGVYSVDKMPDVLIRMLHHPETFVAAHIYDHARRGSWIEFASRYTDGSSHTLTTMAHTGLDRPTWVRTIHADKSTPTDQLYSDFKTQHDRDNIKAIAADEVIDEFEDGYMRHMIWRQNSGITPEEVARVMVTWASRRKEKAAGTSV